MISGITRTPVPRIASLADYDRLEHGYADCYTARVSVACGLDDFLIAFYTSGVFKVERLILGLLGLASSDEEATKLARGEIDSFAAWTVESRDTDQILLADIRGNTRSWLMVESLGSGTTLFFGSAVLPRKVDGVSRPPAWIFRALLGFHQLYSRVLLRAAVRLVEINK